MIEVLPKSIFSWDFTATSARSGSSELTYHLMTEQGTLLFEGIEYEIKKNGAFSGEWRLENSGELVASAEKPSPLFRHFEIKSSDLNLKLTAESAFTRSFEISLEGTVVGFIKPESVFSRKSFIECSNQIPDHLQLFAFWLVGLCWKRAQSSSS